MVGLLAMIMTMKKVPILIFILFLCFQGFGQALSNSNASATIMAKEDMIEIGVNKIKNDTILSLPDFSNLYYDLVIDDVHISDFQNTIILHEYFFDNNRRKTILVNCN